MKVIKREGMAGEGWEKDERERKGEEREEGREGREGKMMVSLSFTPIVSPLQEWK